MKRLFPLAFLSCALLACTAPPVEDTSSSVVVARVGGEDITLGELDASVAAALHDVRAEGLEQLIERRLLAQAAAARGLSVEAMVAEAKAATPAVTDAAVAAFYTENEARLPPDATFEALAPQIRELLEQAREREAVDVLVGASEVEVLLEAPRVEVAAIGPARGPADAAVTIVEFSDYECPYCARAEPVLQQLLALYPDDVRLVYRHMPLSFHAQARPAAIAAVCAEEQDRFWEFHEKLFAHQGTLGAVTFTGLADELALDRAAFESCLEGTVAAERVDRDVRAAEAVGATGTPAFNVNGLQWSGTRSLEAMVELVEDELARARRLQNEG